MNEDFCKRLKTARIKREFTQEEVSNETGISRPLISKYETGKLEPNIDTLIALIELYRINANWLLGTGMDIDEEQNER